MKNVFVRCCATLLLGLPLFMVVSCGGGGGSASSDSGTVSVTVTDADVLYNAVVLRIVQVGAALSGSDGGDGEAIYYNSAGMQASVNILDYPNEEVFHLADIEVPNLPADGTPVCFNQIRFVLAENSDRCLQTGSGCSNYVTVDGINHPLKTPSGTTSGVKVLVKTNNDFCVSTGQTVVEVALDIDPATAILAKPNKPNNEKYILKPTQIRIIEGEWSAADPAQSFVQGTVAVPVTYNTAGVCEEIPGYPNVVFPTVTVGAFEPGSSIDPVAQTITLAEGQYDELLSDDETSYFTLPYTPSELCAERCAVAADPSACEAACLAELDTDSCFYAGNFKLLFPDDAPYDLGATWDGLSASVPYNAAVYNSAVFMQLQE